MPLMSAVGTRPQPLQRRVAAFARRGGQADARPGTPPRRSPSASHCARCELLNRRDLIVEAGQLDAAVLVLQLAQDFRQRVDRVQRGPAIQAGVQIAVGGLQGHLGVGHAAQAGGDGGGLDVPHAGVADQRHVRDQVGLVRPQERVEVDRTDLFLALDQHGDARRDAAAGAVPGAQGFQEHHRLALVVHRAAGDEALAARAIDVLRVERIAVPEGHRIDRLHVVVAVEQDVRPIVVRRPAQMGNDHGMAGGRPDGRHQSPVRLVGRATIRPP